MKKVFSYNQELIEIQKATSKAAEADKSIQTSDMNKGEK